MRWMILICLVAAGLAGCVSSDDAASPDTPTVGTPETLRLMTINTIPGDRGAGEPSLGVTPEGVLFTNVGSIIHRSDDGGMTWTNLGDPNPGIPNNDPDLAVDADGVVWESRLYALICNAVSVSQDGGASWTNNQAVCNLPVGDRQYVIPTQDCTAYLYWHQLPTLYQTVMKTTDCGESWLPTLPAEFPDHHALVNEGSGWGGGGFWNPTTDSVFMTYHRGAGLVDAVIEVHDDAPGYSVTRDGMSWEEGVGPAFDGTQVGLGLVTGAADDAGNVYLAWAEALPDTTHIFAARSDDDGRTWGPKVQVDADAGAKVFPMIAAGNDGHVAVAYYRSSEPGFPDDVGNWSVDLAWTQEWNTPDNATWSHGPLSNGTVKDTPICVSGTACTGGREFLDFFALQRMPDGTVSTVYNHLTEDGNRNVFARTAAPLLGPVAPAAPATATQ